MCATFIICSGQIENWTAQMNGTNICENGNLVKMISVSKMMRRSVGYTSTRDDDDDDDDYYYGNEMQNYFESYLL